MKKYNFLFASILLLTACNNTVSNQQNLILPEQTEIQSNKDKNRYGTAKNDAFMAESKARSWDMSAQLVKIEADFVPEGGYANWVYYFKSPFKRTTLRVETFNTQEIPDSFFGSQFSSFSIRVDSDKAIQKAKEKGLKNFPVSRMTLERRFGLEWELQTYNGVFRINAEDLTSKSK